MTHVALGFRAHSGWAVLVAVAGPPHSPAVIDRRRIQLADPGIPQSTQPYHAAAEMDSNEAEKFLKRCIDGARLLARHALRAVIDELQAKGHETVACGLLLGSGRPATTLAQTLASHALIHTEGELFRDVLAHAGEDYNLPVRKVVERELFSRAAEELGVAADELQRCVAALGQSIGPPWRQDEKHAALVAWLALAAVSRR